MDSSSPTSSHATRAPVTGRRNAVRWVLRIAAGVAALAALLIIALLVGFEFWCSAVERDLSRDSTVVTTSRGPIEYAEVGQGPAVLVIHGTPGGYDESLNALMASHGERNGFRYIAPSRPGYLRTPLTVGRTPAEQADAFAALLDALHIGKAAIIGSSGGGPSALQFALRHPERCVALVLEEAVVRKYSGPDPNLPRSTLSADYRDFRIYLLDLLAKHYANDPKYGDFVPIARAELRAEVPYNLRRIGTENDMAQEAGIGDLPLNQIHLPTLILQGTADQSVPVKDAEYAHTQIPDSQLVELPGEGHEMTIFKHKFLENAILEFLRKHQ